MFHESIGLLYAFSVMNEVVLNRSMGNFINLIYLNFDLGIDFCASNL